MTEPVNFFIPAAGLGERLQPITFHIPKPLLPVAGKPVLEIILERASLLPLKRIGINLHYKGRLIERWIRLSVFREKVVAFPEEPVLGTGGALKNASGFLSNGLFVVHNSDILSDIDLEGLIEFHLSSGNIATIAVIDFPQINNVSVCPDGLLAGIESPVIRQSPAEKKMTFTGIAVYSPEFLRFIPEGISSVVDAWIGAAASGERVGTFDVSGSYWSDIGTPSAYASAVVRAMRSEGENIYIHPSVRGCDRAVMDGYVVIEESNELPENISLRNCIMLPASFRKSFSPATCSSPRQPFTKGGMGENTEKEIWGLLENCIVGPDFVIPVAEAELLGLSREARDVLIGAGGSDREYRRVRGEKDSFVLVRYSLEDKDMQRHIAYTEFFRSCGIPVPELLSYDLEKKEAGFEDLGDLNLYSWLKCNRREEDVEEMYRMVIDVAVMLHITATRSISECNLLAERIFDYEHLRWETSYFVENYVSRIKGIEAKDASRLEEEFHRLALRVDSFPKTVIHRDFQSQNVMIARGVPRLIDYQGARMGPPAYDMASLLWDPYHRLESGLRERLLAYYIEQMKEKGAGFNEGAFRDSLLPCRLQRHMQALGAYGFLSSVKGEKYFLKHVEEGVRLLREDISMAKDDYPALYRLIFSLPAMNG